MDEMYKNIRVPAKIELADVYDFIDEGDPSKAPPDLVDYLDALEKVRSMKRRIKEYATKEHILNHLIKVNGLPRNLANKIYNDAMEYFYLEDGIPKQARRNMYADEQDEDIAIARLAAKSVDDMVKISKMRKEAYLFRALDKDDIQDFPDGAFDRPWKLYTLNPEDVGIPKADRRELSERIDGYKGLTELEKEIIKREAGVLPARLFLDKHEDPRDDSE